MKQKRQLAAKALGSSISKIRFEPSALEEIGKAITRSDIRGLAAVGKISIDKSAHQSRGRARMIQEQKRKGRRKGRGSHKGSKHSLVSRKEKHMHAIRAQRFFLQLLKDKGLVSVQQYHQLYAKCKGGYFRNVRHIKLYITEHQLVNKIASKSENKAAENNVGNKAANKSRGAP